MADFGGLASVLQMQNQGGTTSGASKQTKQQTRKRSLESTDDPNTRVNSKLLQLLKENQEDFQVINGTANVADDPSNTIGIGAQMLMSQDYLNFDYRPVYDENDPNYVSTSSFFVLFYLLFQIN